jgi:hypothetical protein
MNEPIDHGGRVMDQETAIATRRPMPDDLIDRIAREIALEVGAHLETYYPDACRAVAWESCKRSIQGVVRNRMASAGRAAEAGRAEEWLETTRRYRRAAKAGGRCYMTGKVEEVSEGNQDGTF